MCNVDKIWDRNVTANTINSILFDLGKMKIDERWFDKNAYLLLENILLSKMKDILKYLLAGIWATYNLLEFQTSCSQPFALFVSLGPTN